ncbi:MAG: MBL fold metallo-hydrolase [Polyangiaceae bacterium]|nr:MBL fold metallo-hydrolase [Polyangiaceae bacterium]
MMQLTSILGNSQRLDGGAMFGNCPRALWSRWCPPDEQGRIALACRCFLLEYRDQKILIEAGVGAFLEPALRERYGVVEEEHCLLKNLARAGIQPDEIDVVLLSHLHFDHAGGLLSAFVDGANSLVFSKATHVVGASALRRAEEPHRRDRASFLPQLPGLLRDSGCLAIVEQEQERHDALGPRVRLLSSSGHTPGMLLPLLEGEAARALFCADLIPGRPWVHLPITMGYDRCAERLIDEKESIYRELGPKTHLLFTHDAQMAGGELGQEEERKKLRFFSDNSYGEFVRWNLDADLRPQEAAEALT